MELLLAGVFKAFMPASSGLDIQLFKRLHDQWSIIPKDNLQPFLDQRVDEYKDWSGATIASLKTNLETKSTRDDYAELSNLSLYS